jgi:trans-AT polyketide synthase, acyltransferase and oxidoreductase domains
MVACVAPVIHRAALGWWSPDVAGPTCEPADMHDLLCDLRTTIALVHTSDGIGAAMGGRMQFAGSIPGPEYFPLAAILPPLPPDELGDRHFCQAHHLKYPYMTGAMANGIASVEIVEAMSYAGMLGSFGAAGLSMERVTQAIDRLQGNLGTKPFCINLIHSPNEPAHENAMVELLLKKQVRLVEASAFLDVTPSIVRYRVAGLSPGVDGVHIQNRVIAKVSRVEVATKFLSPAPTRILQELLAAGQITEEQAELAARVPMCDDLTAEADSGGHTDNRPAITLLPTMLALRDRIQKQCGYRVPVRVGLAGGIATPASVAGAFSMGAAYVVTGSINQACVESGSSDGVRKMLAEAGQADVAMAPAADMFEMGVKLQVLKRGTMFAMRAQKLYELYRAHPSWEAIPANDRNQIEKTLFRAKFQEIWQQTHDFFSRRDPTLLPKAEEDPRVKMALVFRWYLGLSSRWANTGDDSRQLDYQVWCGPAMGAFNEWTKGSALEHPAGRTVVGVALNLLYNASLHLRRESLRQQGVTLPPGILRTDPLETDELRARLA